MKCARCSAEVPRQSQFCLRCGTPINAANNYAPPASPPGSPIPSAPANNRSMLAVIGVLVVAVLAMAAWMVKSSLAQKPGATNAPSLVQAPAQMGTGPLIQAPAASNTTPVVVAPPSQPVQQPNYADIDDYLKFVRQVELTKQSLIHRELASALSQYGNMLPNQVKAATDDDAGKDFLPNINKDPKNFSEEWNKLTQVFLQRQPPQSCVGLHDKYYDHLGKIQGMFNKVHDAVSQAGNGQSGDAINTLTSMMGTASADADATAQAADDELGDICRNYKLEKTFKIQTDAGSAGSLLH